MQTAIGRPRRKGFTTVTSYLMVEKVDPVVEFLEKAFGATETFRSRGSGGGWHVEVNIGNSMIMLGGDSPNSNYKQPHMMFLYVEDTDAVYQAALQAGASSMMEPADKRFDEERGAGIIDPFGNTWFLATHDSNKTS